MRIVSGTLFNRPLFHLMCNNVCCCSLKLFTFFDRLFQLFVSLLRKSFCITASLKTFSPNISATLIHSFIPCTSLFYYSFSTTHTKRSFFDSNKGVLHLRKTPFIPFSSDAFVHDIIKNQTIQLFRQNRTESFSLLLFQRLHLHPVSEVYVDRILFLQDPFLLQCICG